MSAVHYNCSKNLENTMRFFSHILLQKQKPWLITLIAICLGVFCSPSNAFAWKPTTHVYLGQQALDDALDDGEVTIPRVDYEKGEIIGTVGTYKVDSNILAALRSNPSQYRAGILGPDAYPDIVTGQQVIHPSSETTNIQGGSNAWLEYLWDRSNTANSNAIRAFTVGYITHAAGDMYGHTFVNNFSGGDFAIEPPAGPANAIKHIVVEGYIDKRLDANALNASFFDASIDGIEDFIYQNMIDAKPGTYLNDNLLKAGVDGTKFSIPRIYSNIRAKLQRDIDEYYAKKEDYDRRANACKLTDFRCSRAAILAQKAAYVAANGLTVTYKEAWRADIDRGLKAWPGVSHEVAKALFFNPSGSADTQTAEDILQRYVTNHLLSMSGAPDFVGLGANAINKIISAVTPDFLLEPIRQLKEDFLNTMLQKSIGMTKQELKQYVTSPDKYFDRVMGSGAGENVNLQQFNANYLKISDSGYTNPSESFDYRKVPAAYNTVIMSKLILLNQSEANRLMSDLGSTERLNKPNIMLGFIPTLDGDNQWKNGMVLGKDLKAYQQVFMKQPGERIKVPPTGSTPQGDNMQPGETLNPGQSRSSANGQYTLVYQGDNNLVLYRNRDSQPLWSSNTWGKTNGVCVMQGDGNFVIYDQDSNPVWSSNTWHPGSRLVVQNDGNVVIYRPDGTPAWTTNTWQGS